MRGSRTQFRYSLIATRRDAVTKPFIITPEEWQLSIALSRRNGFSPPEDFGMTRSQIKWFSQALQRAQAGLTDEETKMFVERLLAFCTGEGSQGFTFVRRWESALGAL